MGVFMRCVLGAKALCLLKHRGGTHRIVFQSPSWGLGATLRQSANLWTWFHLIVAFEGISRRAG